MEVEGEGKEKRSFYVKICGGFISYSHTVRVHFLSSRISSSSGSCRRREVFDVFLEDLVLLLENLVLLLQILGEVFGRILRYLELVGCNFERVTDSHFTFGPVGALFVHDVVREVC